MSRRKLQPMSDTSLSCLFAGTLKVESCSPKLFSINNQGPILILKADLQTLSLGNTLPAVTGAGGGLAR